MAMPAATFLYQDMSPKDQKLFDRVEACFHSLKLNHGVVTVEDGLVFHPPGLQNTKTACSAAQLVSQELTKARIPHRVEEARIIVF